jgi:hypothetical protein
VVCFWFFKIQNWQETPQKLMKFAIVCAHLALRERERERERECNSVPAQARPSITPLAVLPNLVVDALSVRNLAPISGLLLHLFSVCSCDQLSPGRESILMVFRFLSWAPVRPEILVQSSPFFLFSF